MEKMTRYTLFILSLLIAPCYVHAQLSTNTHYRFEGFVSAASGDNTPFWIVNHSWGMVPLKANNYYVRGGIFHEQKIDKNWNFSLGVDIAASTSTHAYDKAWLQQIYGTLNYKSFRMRIGLQEDYSSLLDPYLSSGDLSLSNNARPVPQLKLSLSDFVLVPFTEGVLYIKGDFAMGKYLDGNYLERTTQTRYRYSKNVVLHNKSIYFRFGNFEREDDLRFTFGLNHQVQWGGEIYEPNEGGVTNVPQGFQEFISIFLAGAGGDSSTGLSQLYVEGNHAGDWLFKLDYKATADIYSIYLQNFFEDGSGMAFESFPDMLLGFQYKKGAPGLLTGLVLEYINMKKQTGPIHFNLDMDDTHDKVRNKGNGNDDYYNNWDYQQGRSYYGRSLGSPLFLSPEYNSDGRINFKDNRFTAFHIGMEGYLHPDWEYRLLASYGKGYGRYYVPFSKVKTGFAAGMDLIYTFPQITGLDIKVSVGFDQGDFFHGDTFGGAVTIRKSGIF